MAFLSVLIPVYNGEEMISDCIKSVVEQPCNDLEIIISNDGSTDNTSRICSEWCRKDHRIKLVEHGNVGLGANRNIGLHHCTGDWIIFLDHDDLIIGDFYTGELKSFLLSLHTNGVDMIVPSRLMANSTCSRAYYDRSIDYGLVSGGGHESWGIDHEFASCIYSLPLIRNNHLEFEETRPEMETVYRHKAAFLSEKILFAPELYFSIRRSSDAQITKNWNKSEISIVRWKSYLNLLHWHYVKSGSNDNDPAVIDAEKQALKVFYQLVLTGIGRIRNEEDFGPIEEKWHSRSSRYPLNYKDACLNKNKLRRTFLEFLAALSFIPEAARTKFTQYLKSRSEAEIAAFKIDQAKQMELLHQLTMMVEGGTKC